jgi:hypothetical protein
VSNSTNYWTVIAQVVPVLALAVIASSRLTRSTDAWLQMPWWYRSLSGLVDSLALLVAAFVESHAISALASGRSGADYWTAMAALSCRYAIFAAIVGPSVPWVVSSLAPVFVLRRGGQSRRILRRMRRRFRPTRRHLDGVLREMYQLERKIGCELALSSIMTDRVLGYSTDELNSGLQRLATQRTWIFSVLEAINDVEREVVHVRQQVRKATKKDMIGRIDELEALSRQGLSPKGEL